MDSLQSTLFDEKTFYTAFLRDLEGCKREVYIESPYITSNRVNILLPVFKKLLAKGVKIYIVTRNPKDHDTIHLRDQAERQITNFEYLGVQSLLCIGNHHRKLAILDRNILWEGSLNILSQAYSREMMRRMHGEEYAMQMFHFLKLESVLEYNA